MASVSGDLRYSWDDKWGVENTRTIVFSSALIDGFVAVPRRGHAVARLHAVVRLPQRYGRQLQQPGEPLATGVKSIGVILPNGYAQRQLAITDSEVTGSAKVEWTPTPDIFTYASYGRGYASPSFNAGIVSAPARRSRRSS